MLLVMAAGGLWAQTPEALLNTVNVNQLCQRSMQLMEAGGVVIPDLQRASAPIIENVRQACLLLRESPGAGQATYLFMTNLHAY